MTARQQSLLASTSATRSLGSSATSPTGPICSRMALRLFVRCTTANHLGPTYSTASDTSRLCIPLVTLFSPLLTTVSDSRTIQEGSRMFTPVRLGFPRQTLDGASYMGHNIPKDTVRLLSGCELHPRDKSNVFDRPDEYLPERWLDGRKGRTDMLGEGGDKLGVPHLTYGAGRRVHPLSGQPRSLLVACTSPAFLHLGATTSWRGGEEARLPSLPC